MKNEKQNENDAYIKSSMEYDTECVMGYAYRFTFSCYVMRCENVMFLYFSKEIKKKERNERFVILFDRVA